MKKKGLLMGAVEATLQPAQGDLRTMPVGVWGSEGEGLAQESHSQGVNVPKGWSLQLSSLGRGWVLVMSLAFHSVGTASIPWR
jgi:hypothetical protein